MSWSALDLAGHCRWDIKRTSAFEKAIRTCIREGDVVVEIGAGTGVLSIIASRCRATKVIAVESDPTTYMFLRDGLKNYGSDVEVRLGDASVIDLPTADVVIAELIDVWLLEEDFASVISSLSARGVITQRTKIIPCGYEFNLELGNADWSSRFAGIPWPQYQWPLYDCEGWERIPFQSVVKFDNFHSVSSCQMATQSDRVLATTLLPPCSETTQIGTVNAIRLSGSLRLWGDIRVDTCGSMNAPLIIPIKASERIDWKEGLKIEAILSGGIRSLRLIAGTHVIFPSSV